MIAPRACQISKCNLRISFQSLFQLFNSSLSYFLLLLISSLGGDRVVLQGSLQLSIHVVQNRHVGTQKSHWDKTNKRSYHLKFCIPFVGLAPVRLLRPNMAFSYHVNGSCKGPIHVEFPVRYDIQSHVSHISLQKIKLLQAKIIELKKAFQRELVRVRSFINIVRLFLGVFAGFSRFVKPVP